MRASRRAVSSRVLHGATGAGLTMLVTSSIGHLGNYLYYVVAARMLGVTSFADVTVVTAIGTILLLPFTGLQSVVARDVAEHESSGERTQASATVRWIVKRMLVVHFVVLATLASLLPLATNGLGISSATWLVAAAWFASGVLLQVLIGPLQGFGKFVSVGLLLGGPMGAFRLMLLVPLATVAAVPGAIGALLAATLIGVVMALSSLWKVLSRCSGACKPQPATTAPLSGLAQTVGALLSVGFLTNIDVVAAKTFLPAAEAGLYSSASLLGRIAFHAPSALAFVLLPTVTQRLVSGQNVRRPMLLTALTVLGTGFATFAAIVLAPPEIMAAIFGPAFTAAYDLAAPLALVSTVSALLYMQLMLALARRDARLPTLMLLGSAAAALLLVLWGDSAYGIVAAMALAVGGIFLVHEVLSPDGLLRLSLGVAATRRSLGAAGQGSPRSRSHKLP